MSRYLKKEDKFGKQNKRIISLTQKDKKIDRQIKRLIALWIKLKILAG